MLSGGAGSDSLSGGTGSDLLNGAAGSDTLEGGAGADTVLGGSGSDVLIYKAFQENQTAGSPDDYYSGGSGAVRIGKLQVADTDVLQIWLSAEQLTNQAIRNEIEAAQAWIHAQTNANTGQTTGAEFVFTTLNLRITQIESIQILNQNGGTNIKPPTITSNGGGATARCRGREHDGGDDGDGERCRFGARDLLASCGGADAALFTIDASTGALTFVAAPNFEAPTDAGGNNVYDVTVQVSDGTADRDAGDRGDRDQRQRGAGDGLALSTATVTENGRSADGRHLLSRPTGCGRAASPTRSWAARAVASRSTGDELELRRRRPRTRGRGAATTSQVRVDRLRRGLSPRRPSRSASATSTRRRRTSRCRPRL